jgi:DNA-binding GntR family transcriptional regulator
MKTSNAQSASEFAYKAIKEMMGQYALVPGQKIALDPLVEKIKVSKTPIINALNRLEKEDFVISIKNKGFFIKEISLQEFRELYRVRGALEILSVEESIRYGTEDKLLRVREAKVDHDNYKDEFGSIKRFTLDALFHLKIAEMSGSSSLTRLLKQVLEHVYIRQRIDRASPKRLQEAPKEHQEIFEAILNKDIRKAKVIMKHHLQKAEKYAMEAMQKNAGFQL